jgi:dTMP kinase
MKQGAMQRTGRFISVEGGEGAGKSTNIAYARDLLLDAGISVVVTREPGGTPFAEEIRALLLKPRTEPVADVTELLLMFAARVQHCEQLIKPALARGDWVLCDRFSDATLAYQGAGRGIDIERILALKSILLQGFEPDLTLLLDVPVASGLARIADRGAKDRFETENEGFFTRVRNFYLQLAREQPGRFRVVDASQPIAVVQSAIRSALLAYVSAEKGGTNRVG